MKAIARQPVSDVVYSPVRPDYYLGADPAPAPASSSSSSSSSGGVRLVTAVLFAGLLGAVGYAVGFDRGVHRR